MQVLRRVVVVVVDDDDDDDDDDVGVTLDRNSRASYNTQHEPEPMMHTSHRLA